MSPRCSRRERSRSPRPSPLCAQASESSRRGRGAAGPLRPWSGPPARTGRPARCLWRPRRARGPRRMRSPPRLRAQGFAGMRRRFRREGRTRGLESSGGVPEIPRPHWTTPRRRRAGRRPTRCPSARGAGAARGGDRPLQRDGILRAGGVQWVPPRERGRSRTLAHLPRGEECPHATATVRAPRDVRTTQPRGSARQRSAPQAPHGALRPARRYHRRPPNRHDGAAAGTWTPARPFGHPSPTASWRHPSQRRTPSTCSESGGKGGTDGDAHSVPARSQRVASEDRGRRPIRCSTGSPRAPAASTWTAPRARALREAEGLAAVPSGPIAGTVGRQPAVPFRLTAVTKSSCYSTNGKFSPHNARLNPLAFESTTFVQSYSTSTEQRIEHTDRMLDGKRQWQTTPRKQGRQGHPPCPPSLTTI